MQSSRREIMFAAIVVLLVAAGLMLGSPLTAGDTPAIQPYTVYVVQEESHARCGPSPDFYRTDALRHGQALEVYHEAEGGWLAIRPPESSFCWIPADVVQTDDRGDGRDNGGTITEDRTVAWIGTHLGRARSYRWQVQMSQGELVSILGKSEREGPDGPQLWYRIVPPSGEFRWVHRDQVVETSEELVASMTQRPAREETMFAESGPTRPRTNTIAQADETPKFRPASSATESSKSARREVADNESVSRVSGASVLEPAMNNPDADVDELVPIGSGLNETWQANQARGGVSQQQAVNDPPAFAAPPSLRSTDAADNSGIAKRKGLLASVAFKGRPRLSPIGAPESSSASDAAANESGADENWVAGVGRRAAALLNPETSKDSPASQNALAMPTTTSNIAMASLGAPVAAPTMEPAAPPIQQVSGMGPMPAQNLVPTMQTPSPQPMNVVSSQRIEQVRQEAIGADIDRLTVMLSRLMASQASGLESEPVAESARHLASTTSDPAIASRARMLAERADQYRRVATRRDGNSMVRNSGDVILGDATSAMNSTSPIAPLPASTNSLSSPPATMSTLAAEPTYHGQLVQVYSARADSPPFALTDNTGRTIAYVTPVPGVNLRSHLNSNVNVIGTAGFLSGLNMPHVLARQAVRTAE